MENFVRGDFGIFLNVREGVTPGGKFTVFPADLNAPTRRKQRRRWRKR